MPNYLYKCTKCGKTIEVFQSMKAKPIRFHRGSCGGKLTKLISSGIGVVFKDGGVGWAKDGYSRKKTK